MGFLSFDNRSYGMAGFTMMLVSLAYVFMRGGGVSSISQTGLMLYAAAALLTLWGAKKGGGFALLGLALSALILLNVIFGLSFGLSVVG